MKTLACVVAGVVALAAALRVKSEFEMLEGWGNGHLDWLLDLERRMQAVEGVREPEKEGAVL